MNKLANTDALSLDLSAKTGCSSTIKAFRLPIQRMADLIFAGQNYRASNYKALNLASLTLASLSIFAIGFSGFANPCCGQELASTTASSMNKKTAPSEVTEHKFRFDMRDKTRIIGFADVKSIDVDLGFGKVAIPIENVRSLRLAKQPKNETNDYFVIEMQNRDRYSGRVLNPPIDVRFLGGKVKLPFDGMQTLRFISGGGASPVISDGLVLYYDFEGVADDVVDNKADSIHHGRIGDGITRVDSKFGRGIKFTGKRCLKTKNHAALQLQRFTFSAWMKPGERDGEYCFIGGLSKHDGWLGGFAFVYMDGDTDNIHFYVNGYNQYVVKTRLPAKKWTHLSGVFDGKEVVLYANGKRVGSQAFPKGVTIDYPEDPFTLGGENSDFYWHGEMDEVSLHNRALSAEEVSDLFKSTK